MTNELSSLSQACADFSSHLKQVSKYESQVKKTDTQLKIDGRWKDEVQAFHHSVNKEIKEIEFLSKTFVIKQKKGNPSVNKASVIWARNHINELKSHCNSYTWRDESVKTEYNELLTQLSQDLNRIDEELGANESNEVQEAEAIMLKHEYLPADSAIRKRVKKKEKQCTNLRIAEAFCGVAAIVTPVMSVALLIAAGPIGIAGFAIGGLFFLAAILIELKESSISSSIPEDYHRTVNPSEDELKKTGLKGTSPDQIKNYLKEAGVPEKSLDRVTKSYSQRPESLLSHIQWREAVLKEAPDNETLEKMVTKAFVDLLTEEAR